MSAASAGKAHANRGRRTEYLQNSTTLPPRRDHSARADGRKNVQRRTFMTLGSGRSRKSGYSPCRRTEDKRVGTTPSVDSASLRASSRMEKRTRTEKPISLSQSARLEQANGSVKKAWRTTLKRAGVSYFPIYNLRHVFCTRLSWVAPDAVVQRAMRHSSPETKRVYQLGLVHQVREHLERANDKAYQGREALHLRDSASPLRRSPRRRIEGSN
jgi:hypothetical protein